MIVQVSPTERLQELVRNRHSGELMIVNLPKYHCPVCGETTVFEIHESRFDSPESQTFDAASGTPIAYETVHSDFHCRNCHAPVRVVCRMHEFAMSAYQYFPLAVYERELARPR